MKYELLVFVGGLNGALIQDVVTDQPFIAFSVGDYYHQDGWRLIHKVASVHRQVLQTPDGVVDRVSLVAEAWRFAPKD